MEISHDSGAAVSQHSLISSQNFSRTGTIVSVLLLFLFSLTLYAQNLRSKISPDDHGQVLVSLVSTEEVAQGMFGGVNHPLFGLLTHWSIENLGGQQSIAVRLPAFAAGALCPLLFFFLIRPYVHHAAALLAAMSFAFVDSTYYYATSIRGYSQWMVCTMLCSMWLISYCRSGGIWKLLFYSAFAITGIYTHLWMLTILFAHGVFVVVELCRRSKSDAMPVSRCLIAGFAIVLCAVAGGFLYWPMREDVRSLSSFANRNDMPIELVYSLIQNLRFGSFTLSAAIIGLPILVASLGSTSIRQERSLAERLHLTVFAVLVILLLAFRPGVFGSRYLMGMQPSLVFVLAIWFCRHANARTWSFWQWAFLSLAGLGLGVLLALVPEAHNIPPQGDFNQHYSLVYLAKKMGLVGGLITFLIGLAAFWRVRKHPASPVQGSRLFSVTFGFLTLASLAPIIISPTQSMIESGGFEWNLICFAIVVSYWLQFRRQDGVTRELAFAFLGCLCVVAYWIYGLRNPFPLETVALGAANYVIALVLIVWCVKRLLPAPATLSAGGEVNALPRPAFA